MFEIDLSGVFGWDITPSGIKSKLSEAGGDDIQVNISSVGGDVFDGIDIYNQFRQYKRNNPNSQMIARMSGVVASMAAYTAMGPFFDLVTAEDNAAFMIHNSWTFAIGDKNVLRKAANMLDGLDTPMVNLVSEKTGMSKDESQKLLDEESWYFGEQIVEAGFADELIQDENANARMDLSTARIHLQTQQKEIAQKLFAKHTSKAAAALLDNENNDDSPKPGEQQQENNNAMDTKEKQELQELGASAEHERVSSILALKEKYKENLKDKPGVLAEISEICDKAISDREADKGSVLTDINLFLSSGNIQAALESPGATPQGNAGSASGEDGNEPEDEGESW